ncbi:MAG: restriction endonuclease [Lysobacterales bacterium]
MLDLPAVAAFLALVLSSSLAVGALMLAARLWVERDLPEARAGLGVLGPMDTQSFTDLLARAWTHKGHRVQNRADSADGPRLRVHSEGLVWLVDCRHRRDEQVESEHVRSLMHAVDSEAVAGGILVSAGHCSDSLKRSTRGERLRVVDGAGLWALVEPALAPELRRRAGIRISLLRTLRIGLPLLSGLALGVLALLLAWQLLVDSPQPSARARAAPAASVPPPTPEPAQPPELLAPPSPPDAITAERAAPFSPRGASSESDSGAAFGQVADGDPARDQLIADLESLSDVREAWWSSDGQVQLSVQSAIGPGSQSAEQICSTLETAGLGAGVEVRYQVIGNHGFEASKGVVGCR